MVGWTLMLAALALSHAWPTMLTMAAWGFFVFYVAPRANKRARENGWHEAWSQAFHLAMTREMPMEVCLEMVARAAAGMPSDKARLDEMRMSLRELDEELREE